MAQINNVAEKYITQVLDVIKMTLYSHVKVAVPEIIQQNKIIVLGKYVTKLEKVIFVVGFGEIFPKTTIVILLSVSFLFFP